KHIRNSRPPRITAAVESFGRFGTGVAARISRRRRRATRACFCRFLGRTHPRSRTASGGESRTAWLTCPPGPATKGPRALLAPVERQPCHAGERRTKCLRLDGNRKRAGTGSAPEGHFCERVRG